MRYAIIVLLISLTSLCYAQEATGPEPLPPTPPGLPEYQHVITVELDGVAPVDLKTHLPAQYSEAAAEFSAPVSVNDVPNTSQVIFVHNDIPIMVAGACTVTLHWND